MDSRQQFEAWAKTGDAPLEQEDFRWMAGADTYYFSVVRYMWDAWQSSRKAITIDLPIIVDKDWACTSAECESMRQGITMTKHKINAAGIRTK